MSIFDFMKPEEIAGLLSMDNGGLDLTMANQTRQEPSIWDISNLPTIMGEEEEEEEEKEPKFRRKYPDVSGFANYGMTPPQLPVGQGMLAMPGVQDASRPSQARAPVVDPGIPPIQNMPGPTSSAPGGPGLMNMPRPNPAMQNTPGNSQPQPLPNPMQQIGNIMGMIGNPNKENRQQSPAGGLMSYIKSLGV